VLAGPAHLHRDLQTKMRQLRELRTRFTDAQDAADIESFPPPRRRAPDAVKDSTTPTNKINLLTKAAAGNARQLRPPRKGARPRRDPRRERRPRRRGARERPQMPLPYQDASWFVLTKLDSALVSAADGTSASWYRRDRNLFRSLGWRSVVLHAPLPARGRPA